MRPGKPIKLFCAYVLGDGRHGNAEVLHPPIRSFEDVRAVEARIAEGLKPEVRTVALLNWRAYDK